LLQESCQYSMDLSMQGQESKKLISVYLSVYLLSIDLEDKSQFFKQRYLLNQDRCNQSSQLKPKESKEY